MTPAAAALVRTEPPFRECLSCGFCQEVPPLAPGTTAACVRCGTSMRRARHDPVGRALALNVGALILLGVMASTTLMTVATAGINHQADLFSGPEELWQRRMPSLGLVVLITTLIAPLLRLLGTVYVLAMLHTRKRPKHLRAVFAWVERLRPWSMVEVFVFGVFVAYVKLGDLVTIGLGVGVFALLGLTVTLIWADTALDQETVWEEIGGQPPPAPASHGARPDGAITCEVCTLTVAGQPHGTRCPRCESSMHHRKPDSVSRTWALVIGAAIMYVPANLYPVLTVVQLGAGAPSTILGGVEELLSSGMYPLAALVFFASIAVPMLKLVGLGVMLATVQFGSVGWLRDRTRLYLIVRWIGRWSMIDIFMESLLGALVRFGSVVTIQPGMGAVAFCGVVILTMFAAETFDPRLMWDAAAERGTERKAAALALAAE